MHDETTARLAYDEAVRRIAGQMQVLAGVRTRAGTLFGAASLATSFLSSAAPRDGGLQLGLYGKVAVGLFAVATLITMAMFMSVSGLFFSISGARTSSCWTSIAGWGCCAWWSAPSCCSGRSISSPDRGQS
jgi:hypothetical protein